MQFNKKHCNAMASELTLANMLALVPLMTVAVSLMAIFPAFDNLNEQVQELIFKNLLPDTGLQVQNYLNEYVNKSRKLSAIGLAFLILTSLLLMRSVDKAINTIWESTNRRKGIHKWLAYWAMLTMAPILIAASLVVSSYFASLPLLEKVTGLLSVGLPFVLITLAFTALNMITPYHEVKFKKALIAAVFTAVLFEAAKYGFAIFVTKFSTYELIYGAITAIPLFFLWVYFSWLILLLGAVICFALHRFDSRHEVKQNEFLSVLSLTEYFVRAQDAGVSTSVDTINEEFNELHEQTIRNLLEQLVQLNLLVKLENDEYCLKVNGKELTITEIYRRGDWRLPNNQQINETPHKWISQWLESANMQLDKELKQTLESNIENT